MLFPLIIIMIECFTSSKGFQLPFTLRSQIDGNILKTVESAEKILSVTSTSLNEDKNATKSESMVELSLKPLYFRLDDLSVHVSDMRLSSSGVVIEQTDWDVLGHRLMPTAYFKWIQVNGKIKTSLGSASSDKYSFRLIQNDVRGKGIVSLKADLKVVTWAYFSFKENTTILELQNNEGNQIEMIPNTNVTEFSEVLSLKLQRDVNHQLTQLVTKRINQTLYNNSKISDLDPYADKIRAIGINNTENANYFIDNILKIGQVMIRNKFGDRIKIPDIHEQFAEKYVITFRGSFKATEGSAIGISTVYRVGDIVFGYDNESMLHFYGTLGVEALHLYYDQYKAEFWGMGPSGSLDTTLSPLSVVVHIHLNTTSRMLTLNRFKVANVGDLEVSLTGLGGMVNWLVSRVASWVVGVYRDQVLSQLESQYEQYAKDVFATYDIEQLLNGVDNEPERFD